MPTGRDKAPREPSGQPARPARPARRANPPALLRLQASAGNAAVSGLVALQRQGCPAPPVAPPGVTPQSDPKFQSLKKDVAGKAGTAKAHPPAGAEVKKAQDAAVAPTDDKDAQAKAAQADKMAAAKPAGFDKAAFIAAVNAAIAKQAPKNLDEADKFATSGKADQVKSEVLGKVTSGKDASAKDVTDRTKEPPDPSRAVEKPVTPLPEPPPAPALAPPDARKATPDKAPPEQTDLRAGQCETHGAMAAAGVTDQQLAESNEPEFTGALAAKREGEQHTASAPAAVRDSEAGQLAAVTGAAQASGQAAMAGMTGARSSSAQRGQAAKSATKSKDEQDRARITGEIKVIFDETKTKVEGVLGTLDEQVAKKFEAGEAQAKAAFTADHQARMKRYKDERYDGITGAARWAYDLFADLPAEANNLFLEAKKVYESKMQGVIGDIADFVGQKLGEAKQLIADGRTRVQQKVASQSPALRKIAGEAAKEFGGQFDDLEKSVDEKQDALVEDLAQKYGEARAAVDEEIKILQAENKGLWSKAKEAVGGAIETILKLKDMLLGVLSRAANAVGLIIAKPIEFLGNLVNAVKTGVLNFGANIVQHLKDGLKGWLLGNLASAGIEIPEALDAKGILKMVLSLLGLTWASVRARILRFIPEPVLAKLEQTLDVVKVLITEGVPGLWRWIVEKLGDLKELVLGQIKDFVIEKIVKAGITWIISMLNPAAAFIKACKAIYDIVMFFVDKAAQIKEFVDSVLDSVESIARGGAGAVAGLIERTLAKALPMVLGFLASLLGLGGISEKIKSVLEKVQSPVGKVIDSVVGTIVKAGKKVWSKLKGKARGGDDTPEGKQKRLETGVKAGVAAANRFAGRAVGDRVLKPVLGGLRIRHGLSVLEPVKQDKFWAVHGTVSRMTEVTTVKVAIPAENIKQLTAARQSGNNLLKKTTEPEVAKAVRKKASLSEEANAKLVQIQAELAAAAAEHQAHYAESEEISKSRMGDPARVDALIRIHLGTKQKCEHIGASLTDLTRGPEQLQKEADELVKGIETGLRTAKETLADEKVRQFVVNDPFHGGLGTDLAQRIAAMQTAYDSANKKVDTLAGLTALRGLKKQSEELSATAARAKSRSNSTQRVALLQKTLDNIYLKTTEYGTKGDRTTEAALIFEAESGEPWMSPTGHLIEVNEMRAAVVAVAAELEHLRESDRGIAALVATQLARATSRITRFDRGLAVWNNRVSLHPTVWDENGKSRKKPGWPK